MTSSGIIELPHMGEIKVYHCLTPSEAAQHVIEQTHNIMSRPKRERDEALRRNRRLTRGRVMRVVGSLDQGDRK